MPLLKTIESKITYTDEKYPKLFILQCQNKVNTGMSSNKIPRLIHLAIHMCFVLGVWVT